MSRFFRGDSSSESSSDEEELYSDQEEEEEKAASSEEESSEEEDEDEDDSDSDSDSGPKKSGANAFLRDDGSDSEESSDEDGVKVVKSAKDKRFEELEATIKSIDNGEKINDWGVISNGGFHNFPVFEESTDKSRRIRQAQPTGRKTGSIWNDTQAIYQGYC